MYGSFAWEAIKMAIDDHCLFFIFFVQSLDQIPTTEAKLPSF